MCNTGAYTATCEAVRRAARRAADELGESWEPVDIYGGGSPRKATADLLYASGHTKKMVADVGGWMLREDAADLYLRANEVTRRKILGSLMMDLVGKGQMQLHLAEQAMERRAACRPKTTHDRRPENYVPDPEMAWFALARWKRVR